MSEESDMRRCPNCDAVVPNEETVCIMCGTHVSLPEIIVEPTTSPIQPEAVEGEGGETAVSTPTALRSEPARVFVTTAPEIVESVMREQQSAAVKWLTAVYFIIIIIISGLILKYQAPVSIVQFVPTQTPIPPTNTFVPTPTPTPTETKAPTLTPTITLTPLPTATTQPPRIHIVSSGETLTGLSIIYRVPPEVIAETNGFSVDSPVQINQNLLVPWPTPTPPLEMLPIDVNGEIVIIDPTGCERYEVREGDSLVGIATLFGLNFEYIAQVNRIADPSLLQPGDTVCIPEIIYGGENIIPPTAGPSPTPSLIPPPSGPHLLYPPNNSEVEPPDGVLALQWIAVKDLAGDEMYMIELSNMDMLDIIPFRGFTRDSSFIVPSQWRPTTAETQRMRWRVSIIKVTGERSDGVPTYSFGGKNSVDAYFFWFGAIPTPTPLPTPTPTPSPTTIP